MYYVIQSNSVYRTGPNEGREGEGNESLFHQLLYALLLRTGGGGGGSSSSLSLDGLSGESGGSTSSGTTALTALTARKVGITTITVAALTMTSAAMITAVMVVSISSRGDSDALESVQAHGAQEFLGLSINDDAGSEVLHDGVVGDDVLATLTLFLLETERDTAHRSAVDALHQMGGVASNLVAEALGRDQGDLTADLLVGGEVQSQLGVVLLDDDTGGLLDGLVSDTTLQTSIKMTTSVPMLFYAHMPLQAHSNRIFRFYHPCS